MTPVEREAAVLERVKASLIAEGYDVVTHPTDLDLPEFLHALYPDAIAHRGSEHVVVEVTTKTAPTQAKLRLLRQALSDQPDWHLRTVWTSGSSVPRSLQEPPLPAVESALQEVSELLGSGHLRAAFLMCWAALEGLGRLLLPEDLQKPQTPGRLLEYLGSRGLVGRREAANLRKLVQRRNQLVHGELQAPIGEEDVIEIRDVLWKLHDLARDRA